MAFEAAAEFPQGHQFIEAHLTCSGPHCIEQRRGVAFGKDYPVVVRVMRIGCIEPEYPAEEQAGHEVRCGKR